MRLCREIFHFPETQFCRLCNALCGTHCVALCGPVWHTLCGIVLHCVPCVVHTVCSSHVVSVALCNTAQCTMYSATRCTAFCNETNQAEILPTSPFWRSALAAEHLAKVEYLSIQMQSGFLILWGGFLDFLAIKGCCLQQLIERKMINCCQGSVGCRLRHDLAADPCSTQYPAHEARAGEREREIGQRMGWRARTQLLGSPSPRFIQSDETCSPSIPIQVFELAPAFVLQLCICPLYV